MLTGLYAVALADEFVFRSSNSIPSPQQPLAESPTTAADKVFQFNLTDGGILCGLNDPPTVLNNWSVTPTVLTETLLQSLTIQKACARFSSHTFEGLEECQRTESRPAKAGCYIEPRVLAGMDSQMKERVAKSDQARYYTIVDRLEKKRVLFSFAMYFLPSGVKYQVSEEKCVEAFEQLVRRCSHGDAEGWEGVFSSATVFGRDEPGKMASFAIYVE